MKPTPEQLKDPKWWSENAPRWATKALYYSPRERTIFSDGNFYKSVGGEIFNHYDDYTLSLEKCEPLATRPTQWMPEVGEWCEHTTLHHKYGSLFYIGLDSSGFKTFNNGKGDLYKFGDSAEFRPIQSDRDKWKAKAMKLVKAHQWTPEELIEDIYDAGLAKLPENEE